MLPTQLGPGPASGSDTALLELVVAAPGGLLVLLAQTLETMSSHSWVRAYRASCTSKWGTVLRRLALHDMTCRHTRPGAIVSSADRALAGVSEGEW